MFGQDIFTLRSSMFEGRPPKSVNMHWRRFRIADIPFQNEKAFDIWLRNRWTEKDHLLEYFQKHNRFPADKPWERLGPSSNSLASSKSAAGALSKPPRHLKFYETQVKSKGLEEFLSMFAPVTALGIVLYLFYGASTDTLPNFPDLSALQNPEGFAKILENVPGNDIPVSTDMKKMLMDAASYLGGQQMEVKRTDEEIEREVNQLAKTIAKKQPQKRPGLARRGTSSSSSSSYNLKDLNLTSATGKPITLANGVVIHPKAQNSSFPNRTESPKGPVKLANGLVINQPGLTKAANGKPSTNSAKPIVLANGMTLKQPSAPKPDKPGKPMNLTADRLKAMRQPPNANLKQKPLKPHPLSVSSTIANDRAMSMVSAPSTATISTTARRAPPSVASHKSTPRKLVNKMQPKAAGKIGPGHGKAIVGKVNTPAVKK